jgi:hypothetical protein
MLAGSAFVIWLTVRFGSFAVAMIPHDPDMGQLAGRSVATFMGDLQRVGAGAGSRRHRVRLRVGLAGRAEQAAPTPRALCAGW